MAKKSTFKSNWPKYLLQWGVLALLVFFLSGLASLVFTDMNAPDPKNTALSVAWRHWEPISPTVHCLAR